MRILHLSDPHFGTNTGAVSEQLLAAADALAPDLIIVSGDITQRARKAQFEAAARFIERLPAVPRLMVPGNHDIPLYDLPRRIFAPYERFTRILTPELAPSLQLGDIEVIGFNSAPPWRHRNGELDIDEVDRELALYSHTDVPFRICVFHHPPDVRRFQDRINLIKRAPALCRVLARHAVDLVMSGHIHDPMMRTSHHRYPWLERSMVFLLAGTCISRRTRIGAPNSFNCIETDAADADMRIERWDLDTQAGAFKPVQVGHFHRTPDGWTEAGRERPYHLRRPHL